MKHLLAVGAVAATLCSIGQANAQVVGTAVATGGNFLTLSGTGLSNGTTQIAILTGGTVYTSDQPFADIPKGGVFGGSFLAAGPTSGALATLTFLSPTNYLNFLWGSPDSYNLLTVNTSAGTQTFTTQSLGFLSNNGNQSYSQYVQFQGIGNTTINSISFTNSPMVDAFESANFAVAVTAVPEPAAWAMMIVGLGGIGFALRRRAKARVRVAYAA